MGVIDLRMSFCPGLGCQDMNPGFAATSEFKLIAFSFSLQSILIKHNSKDSGPSDILSAAVSGLGL